MTRSKCPSAALSQRLPELALTLGQPLPACPLILRYCYAAGSSKAAHPRHSLIGAMSHATARTPQQGRPSILEFPEHLPN